MVLGDHFGEEIICRRWAEAQSATACVEPGHDLAVLGGLDGQEFSEAADLFDAFCSVTKPVQLAIDEHALFVHGAAYVFRHNKGIVPMQISQVSIGGATLWFKAAERIDNGTSGSPVVTSDGRLLGIFSHSGESASETTTEGSIPRVHFTAPVWLVRQMVTPAIGRALDSLLPPGLWRRR